MNTLDAAHCVIALLTPAGRGAVATIGVYGDSALRCVGALFDPAAGQPLESFAYERPVFGRWKSGTGSDVGEELVVCCRDARMVEVHCHGGRAASEAILASLEERGARRVNWEKWLATVQVEPWTASAREALARATTERAAAVLLDQWRGAFADACQRIELSVRAARRDDALHDLGEMLRFASLGLHLTQPWHVVLAGRPNVGKSSLINALAGYRRAIVSHEPGTTRDIVTATTALDGWAVELRDTAGQRTAQDAIEAAGISLARQACAAADLVVLVIDPTQPWNDFDRELLAALPRSLIVQNKSDLALSCPLDGRPAGLLVSAERGDGVERLASEIAARLVPQAPAPGQAVPWTRQQVDALIAGRDAVASGDLAAAARVLTALRAAASKP